jgi:hypothetical protein
MAGGLLKAVGLGVAIVGVTLIVVQWVWTVVGVLAGIGLTIVGERLAPGDQTGAFTARYTMESGGWGDMHYVKPPGGNVSDPMPGRAGRRFTGR